MSESKKLESESKSLNEELWAPLLLYEARELSGPQVAGWFEALIETGYIWKLPTAYLISATELLSNGLIGDPQRELDS